MRFCTKCKILKNEEDFYVDKRRKRKPNGLCKNCHLENCKKWVSKNRQKVNLIGKRSRWKAAGIDVGIALCTLHRHTKCMICGSKDRLVLDHCHNSKRIRGVLCDPCNTSLGKFKDSLWILFKALVYLMRFKI